MEANKIIINYHADSESFNQIIFIKDGEILTVEPFQMQAHSRYLNMDITEFQRIGIGIEVEEMLDIIILDDYQFDPKSDYYCGFINLNPKSFIGSVYDIVVDPLFELIQHPERYTEKLKERNVRIVGTPNYDELIIELINKF